MSERRAARLRAERAAARRDGGYPAEVVPRADPKPALYADLDPLERLARMAAL